MAASVSEGLASFLMQVRGIKFYHVSTSSIRVGDSVFLCLEPSNLHDGNCIAVWLAGSNRMLVHLAREVASDLAPLVCSGLTTSVTLL